MDRHQMNENVYQETEFDEKQVHHMGGRKYDDGSSSESDFEYITEDSLLCRSSLPTSRKTSIDLSHTRHYDYRDTSDRFEIERNVSSDDFMSPIVDCDFKHVGCDVRLPQRDMPAHLEQAVVYHLSIQTEAIKALRCENEELEAKYENLKKKHQALESKVNELLNVVENLQASTREKQTLGVSKSLDYKPQNNSSEDHCCLPNTFTKCLSHSLLPAVPKVLPRSSSKRPMSASFPLSAESYVDDGAYINDDEMPKLKTSMIKNEDNRQYSYILVEPTSPLPLDTKQPQKSTKLIVTNFERHRIGGGSWISSPFYTHSQGYRMCLKVTANGQGSGKDTHITVAVYLMKGEFDDQLEWPFRGDITIQLLNQQGDQKEHFTRTIYGAEAVKYSGKSGEKFISAWGINQFKSHTEVYQKFLKNDSLKFQVATIIKPSLTSPDKYLKKK